MVNRPQDVAVDGFIKGNTEVQREELELVSNAAWHGGTFFHCIILCVHMCMRMHTGGRNLIKTRALHTNI